jgi:hypothetical protein
LFSLEDESATAGFLRDFAVDGVESMVVPVPFLIGSAQGIPGGKKSTDCRSPDSVDFVAVSFLVGYHNTIFGGPGGNLPHVNWLGDCHGTVPDKKLWKNLI